MNLCEIAKTQPQAAYAAYVHGFKHKFTYFLRTIQDISVLLQPIEDIITNQLLPVLLGSDISADERKLFSLPTRLGGLGINNLVKDADSQYATSKSITRRNRRFSRNCSLNTLKAMFWHL